MGILEESDKRFKGIEKKIGIFVLAAIFGVLIVVILIGIEQDVFTSKSTVGFIADSGQGLSEGMAVKLKGFKIGKVEKVILDDDAKVYVVLSIMKRHMKWIKTDSKAKLSKEGMIGEGIIEIVQGSIASQNIAENGTISFERTKEVGAIIGEIENEIMPMLKDIRHTVDYISHDPKGGIKVTLKNLSDLSAGFIGTRQYLDSLIQNIDNSVGGISRHLGVVLGGVDKAVMSLDNTIKEATNTVKDVNGIVKNVDGAVPTVITKVNKSLDNVEQATGELNKTLRNVSTQLPPIMDKGAVAADSANEVLDSVKQVWPISSHIDKPREKTIKVDSFE